MATIKPSADLVYTGCRHLDYDDHYPTCTLIALDTDRGWYCWRRDPEIYKGDPLNVQFCRQRGRISDPFRCINAGELGCYEAQDD